MITGYRHAAYDTPWWANPSRRPGRYHGPGDPPTQYLSLHPLGPAAEMLRHHVGPASIQDADTVLLNLWAAQVSQDGVITVDFETCGQFGITPEDLVDEDYRPCQRYVVDPFTPEEIRTGHLTDGARAPAEVLPLVRCIGAPHPSLEEWRRTGSVPGAGRPAGQPLVSEERPTQPGDLAGCRRYRPGRKG